MLCSRVLSVAKVIEVGELSLESLSYCVCVKAHCSLPCTLTVSQSSKVPGNGINIRFHTPLRETFFGRYLKKFFGRPKPKGTRAMRRGTSRKMPRKSTGLTDRLTLPMRPELLREIDQVRGDVPRVAWIRRELALAVTRHRPRPRKRDGKSK